MANIPEYVDWSSQSILFSRADHPMTIPKPGVVGDALHQDEADPLQVGAPGNNVAPDLQEAVGDSDTPGQEEAGNPEESILGNLSSNSDDASSIGTEEYNRLTKELEIGEEADGASSMNTEEFNRKLEELGGGEQADVESAQPMQVLATVAPLDQQETEDEDSNSDPGPSNVRSPLDRARPRKDVLSPEEMVEQARMDLVAQSDILNKPITPEEAADPEALEAKRQEMLATAQKFAKTTAAMLEERTIAVNFVDHFQKKDREVDESLEKVRQLEKHWEAKLEALEESELGTLLRVPSTGNTNPEAASDAEARDAPRPAKRKRAAPSSPSAKRARDVLSIAATRKAEAEKKRLKLIDTSNRAQSDIHQFFRPSGSSESQPPKAPKAPKKKSKPSPATIPVTTEVEVPPKATSTAQPDPKDVINVDDIPEDPAAETAQGDSGKGASSSAPPPEQPTGTSAEPTAEQYEQKVQLIRATGASKTPSLQKLPLSQRHAEISAMMEKVWGPADTEMKELSDLESELKVFFAKHKEVRQSTRKLHEDLRVHVLEQMTEIEGLRQNAESSRQAVLRLEARLKEETDKRPTIDALSAKIQVLEAENESLKNFLKETSEKETKEKKDLSEKHAREMAELADKLKKSHQRVTTLAAKNKSQEAEAEAIDKLIFPSLGFEWTKESTLPRTEAYDEARTSIVNLVEACRGIAKSLSLKKAKTTVIDRMTKLMQNVPELIKDWQESSSRGVAALVLATCKAHFPTMKFADLARGVHKDTVMRQHLSEAMGFDRLFAGRVNHLFWYNKYDLPKGFSDPEEEEEAAEEGDEEGSGSSADHDEEDSDLDDGGSDGGSDDGSAYVASDEEQSSENL
nr:altered inheritance of mitochondria protein 21-like [Lolium perenne]